VNGRDDDKVPDVTEPEAIVNAANPSIEGITLVTSPEGRRFERTQLRAFVVAIALGGFCRYGVPGTSAAWAEIVFQTIIFLVPFLGLSYAYNTWEWGSSFRVEGDQVQLVKCMRTRNIPLSDVRCICVEYSSDGHHRLVTLRTPYLAYYRVRDPEHGDALEAWAKEQAAGMGVDVQIRRSWFLSLGGRGTWVLYCTLGVVGGLIAGMLYSP
jgi:hypothetical protein